MRASAGVGLAVGSAGVAVVHIADAAVGTAAVKAQAARIGAGIDVDHSLGAAAVHCQAFDVDSEARWD